MVNLRKGVDDMFNKSVEPYVKFTGYGETVAPEADLFDKDLRARPLFLAKCGQAITTLFS